MALKYADWARLVSMTSAIWTIWGAIWGIFYRKFFWDMLGATLGPAGLEPPPSSDFFVAIIVKFPIVQIMGLLTGALLLAIDWPIPILKSTFFIRSHLFKVGLLFFHSFLSTSDSAVVSWIAIAIYIKAQILGERIGHPEPARKFPSQV